MSNKQEKGAGATAFAPWRPEKPADKYTDDEIRDLDSYKQAARMFPNLKDEQRLSLTREAIKMEWQEVRAKALNDDILSLLADARERGLIKKGVTALTIFSEKDDDGNLVGRYSIPAKKRGRRKRFTHDDYSTLVNREFVKEVTNSRKKHEERNGTYIFRVEEAYEQDDDTSAWWKEKFGDVGFSATLIQKPVNGDKLPNIVFPPEPGRESEEDCRNDDSVIEVTNMTNIMGASRLKHPQSPAVYFKLDEVELEDDDSDDADDASDDAAPESRVHEALDDDEEDED